MKYETSIPRFLLDFLIIHFNQNLDKRWDYSLRFIALNNAKGRVLNNWETE